MGVVDLALDAQGRPVAVKRLALHGSIHDMHRARLRVRREAAALAALDHPGIVRAARRRRRRRRRRAGDALPRRRHAGRPGPRPRPDAPGRWSRDLADQLLGALAAAHRAGIVHRDIKPANVLFDEAGHAYLTDFGVATMRDATSGLTATEIVVGTPEFMAPEQARGERATPASDVFSLGATLRYAATGHAAVRPGRPPGDPPPGRRGQGRPAPARAAPRPPRAARPHARPATRAAPDRGRRGTGRRPAAPACSPRPALRPADRGRTGHRARGRPSAAVAPGRRRRPGRHGRSPWPPRRRDGRRAAADEADRHPASPATSPTTTTRVHAARLPGLRAPGGPVHRRPAVHRRPRRLRRRRRQRLRGGARRRRRHERSTRSITANLVPADDIDRYPFHVDRRLPALLRRRRIDVTLTAPAGRLHAPRRGRTATPARHRGQHRRPARPTVDPARPELLRRRQHRPAGPRQLGRRRPHAPRPTRSSAPARTDGVADGD